MCLKDPSSDSGFYLGSCYLGTKGVRCTSSPQGQPAQLFSILQPPCAGQSYWEQRGGPPSLPTGAPRRQEQGGWRSRACLAQLVVHLQGWFAVPPGSINMFSFGAQLCRSVIYKETSWKWRLKWVLQWATCTVPALCTHTCCAHTRAQWDTHTHVCTLMHTHTQWYTCTGMQNGEEKAAGRPYGCLSIPKGGLQ